MGKIVASPETTPVPIAGKVQMYYKNDNLLYYLQPDGTEIGPIRPADLQGIFRNGRQVIYYDEFLTTDVLHTSGAAISSGTVTQRDGSATEIGVVALNSSATANAGYRYTTHSSTTAGLSCKLQSGYALKAKILQEYNTSVTVRLGFHNTISVTAPTNGAYFEIVNGIAKGVCTLNSGSASTINTYALMLNVWYIATLIVQSGSVTFKIYDASESSELFSENVSSNIPTNAVGWGVVATESSTTARNGILLLDYMRVDL